MFPTAIKNNTAPHKANNSVDNEISIRPLSDDEPLHMVTEFKACLIGDMLVYKLGAFITDLKAQLIEIKDNKILLKVGQRRFLPSWSGCSYDRPIEIELSLAPDTELTSNEATKRCHIITCIKPVGWVRDKQGYERRVKELVRSLRSYFMAE